MRLSALASLLTCEVVCGQLGLDREFAFCFAADLMSDVLAFSAPHALLITGLATVQSVHTADIAECTGLLLVSGKRPSPDALHLGLVKDLPILSTSLSMFEVCGMLWAHGLHAMPSRPDVPPSGAEHG